MIKYPLLEVKLSQITNNARFLTQLAAASKIQIAGVIKGADSSLEVARAVMAGGVKQLADSRIEKIVNLKQQGLDCPMMLLRLPAKSEIDLVVEYADYSLNSELATLKLLNQAAGRLGRRHKVILMQDLGDLREGYFDSEELLRVAEIVENQLQHLELAGVGANLSCYGSVKPTVENLSQLVATAQSIEQRLGRQLEIVSGGATTSLPLLLDGQIPAGINHLRVGEGMILARDLKDSWGYPTPELRADNFILKAEIIELKTKPSHPIGELFMDAFGQRPNYRDRGLRRRALLAVGKKDLGNPHDLIPLLTGVEIVGGSSDHTIVDITDVQVELQIGDILEFNMTYGPMLYLSSSTSVKKQFLS